MTKTRIVVNVEREMKRRLTARAKAIGESRECVLRSILREALR
jgi:plasmid stability protein